MVRGECSTGRLRRTLSGCAEEPRTRRVCGFGKRRREPASEAARYVVRERPVGGLAHDAAQPNLAGEALLPAASVAQHAEPPVFNGSAPRGSERENTRPHTLVVKFQLVCERDAAGRCCQTSRWVANTRVDSSIGGDAQESDAQDSANHRVHEHMHMRMHMHMHTRTCATCDAAWSDSIPPLVRASSCVQTTSDLVCDVDDHSCPGPRAASSSGGGDQWHAEVCCGHVQLGSAGDC